MEADLVVAVVTDNQDFIALEEEWNDLYHHSTSPTAFQSWPFLYSWWESFGDDYKLRLITMRDRELLIGLIPLMLESRWCFRKLLFIGDGEQLDLLARRGWEDKVSVAGVRALRQMNSWHVIDLRDLSPAATMWHIFRKWHGPRVHKATNPYVFMEVKPWDDLLASLGRGYRSAVRRTLRRAEEDGVHSVLAGPEEVKRAALRLVNLHREQWRERGIARIHLTPEFESFIVAAARRMTDRGLGVISEFWREDRVIMSSFSVFGGEVTDAYLVGVSHEAAQRYQWSSLGIYDVARIARSRDSPYVCLDAGRNPYKRRWGHKEIIYYRAILGQGPVTWALYSTYLALHAGGRKLRIVSFVTNLIRRVTGWWKRS